MSSSSLLVCPLVACLAAAFPCLSSFAPADKWTQWIFLKLWERGLVYEAEAPVNWCPALGTVLANEEVTADGLSERGNHPVEQRPMKQW